MHHFHKQKSDFTCRFCDILISGGHFGGENKFLFGNIFRVYNFFDNLSEILLIRPQTRLSYCCWSEAQPTHMSRLLPTAVRGPSLNVLVCTQISNGIKNVKSTYTKCFLKEDFSPTNDLLKC